MADEHGREHQPIVSVRPSPADGQPPAEAYRRVTNAERFRPLHDWWAALLDRLTETYEVERSEGFGLDPELERIRDLARPTIRLTPIGGGAPIVGVFNTFPAIAVRFGLLKWEFVPSCGCDACNEDATDEFLRLAETVDNVTAGRFREFLKIPTSGEPEHVEELWSALSGSRADGDAELSREEAP